MFWKFALRFFIGAGLLFLYFFWWYLSRQQKPLAPKRQQLSPLFLNLWGRLTLFCTTIILFQILGYVLWPISLPSSLTEGVVRIAGLLCFAAGGAIAVWGRTSLGRSWADDIGLRKEHHLVTSGAYRYFRHPIYLGVSLVPLGAELALASWFFLLTIPIALMLHQLAKKEEALLKGRFGAEYLDYEKQVGRIPRK